MKKIIFILSVFIVSLTTHSLLAYEINEVNTNTNYSHAKMSWEYSSQEVTQASGFNAWGKEGRCFKRYY